MTSTNDSIREPDEIRRSCSRKLHRVHVIPHFAAIRGCLRGEDWFVIHKLQKEASGTSRAENDRATEDPQGVVQRERQRLPRLLQPQKQMKRVR
jgi:hypothetical protein